jgi:RND family efflux transporter MFP subunit
MIRGLLLILSVSAVILADGLTLSGTVISDNMKMITSRFMGYVTDVRVSDGQRVNKNDLLYSIDSKDIDSAKTQAEMSLQMYRSQYMNVELNLKRHKRLLEQDMVSRYEVENLELAAANLQDMIKIAEARLREVENQYKYLKVKAPNKGVVISTNVKVGEMAIPGMPAVVLSDLSDLKIVVEIAENDLSRIKMGDKVEVLVPSVNLQSAGTVSAIIPNSNPMTHSFKVKISFTYNEKLQSVYPGMYATVNIN